MEKYFIYLDEKRKNGIKNLRGIIDNMQNEFPELNYKCSEHIYIEWIRTFITRHGKPIYKT